MKRFFPVLCLCLGACSSGPGLVGGAVQIENASSLPAPQPADMIASPRPHYIGPFDTLGVEVVDLPQLSREVQVDSSGTIALPVAGVIQASGKTPIQLAEEIRARLADGPVRNPQVLVNVRSTVSQVVTVDGQVKKPGVYPITGRMTMLRAIATAEGDNDFADLKHVVIFRTVDNKRMAAIYDVRAIRAGAYPDPEIYPNDLISVDDSQTRRLLPIIVQSVGVLLTPLVYILVN